MLLFFMLLLLPPPLLVYGYNGIFMQTNHKLNIVLITLSMCFFYALSSLIMPTMKIHARPSPSFYMHMICYAAISYVVVVVVAAAIIVK